MWTTSRNSSKAATKFQNTPCCLSRIEDCFVSGASVKAKTSTTELRAQEAPIVVATSMPLLQHLGRKVSGAIHLLTLLAQQRPAKSLAATLDKTMVALGPMADPTSVRMFCGNCTI